MPIVAHTILVAPAPGGAAPAPAPPSWDWAVPSAAPLTGGALSITVTWDAVSGAEGYVVFLSTTTQEFGYPWLYVYRYLVSSGSASTTISNLPAGAKYVRIAAHQSGYVGDLSFEQTYTPA